MKRKLLTFILALALVFTFGLTANAGMKDYWAQVYSWDGTINADGRLELTKVTSGITYVVMMADSVATLESLYYYDSDQMTTQANPVTGTNYGSTPVGNDMIRFRCDPTEAGDEEVDLIVVDQAGGYTAFVEDFTQYKHSIVIDERPNVRHHGCAFIVTTGSSTEIDTGIQFDRISVIDSMAIEVGTAMSGSAGSALVSFGLAGAGTHGDTDGFIIDEELATAGWHDPWRAGVNTSDSLATLAGEQIAIHEVGAVGAFIGYMSTGTSDTGDGEGILLRTPKVIHGTIEQSLVYMFSTSDAATGWALLHFWFTRVH
jgi:hypothetical protein